MTKLRKKIAFKFRFFNSSNSVNNISPKKLKIFNFRKKINKMNKILKISKSIRDKMFKDLYTIKSDDMKNNNIYGYNYSFKAEYYTLVDNQTIFLLRNNFEILEMVIDGQKVEPSLEYNFPLKGYHIVHILLNNSNNINRLLNIFFSII